MGVVVRISGEITLGVSSSILKEYIEVLNRFPTFYVIIRI